MSIAKRLKLYRIKTVLSYIPESWHNSKSIDYQYIMGGGGNRFRLFLSLLYWFYFYGHDFNDYCTFRFWEKSHAEKKSYISLRRNDQLRFALSTPKVYDIFLDKVTFNKRFSKFIKRNWIEINNMDAQSFHQFVDRYGTAIFKPRTDFGGHGVKKVYASDNFVPSCEGIVEECIQTVRISKSWLPVH